MKVVSNSAITAADLIGAARVDTGPTHTTLYYAGDQAPALASAQETQSLPPLTAAEFRARFTDAEMAAILMLAYAGAGDVHAAMLLLKLQTSSEIDTASDEVQAGLAYLTARGVLGAGRAAEIAAG